MHCDKVAYHAYEGRESQLMNKKKLNEISFNAKTKVTGNDN